MNVAIVASLAAIPVAILAFVAFVAWATWSLTHWGQSFTGPDEPARQATDEVTR